MSKTVFRMRRFGLLGRHLAHSFSPAYFRRKFEQPGLRDCSYEVLDWPDLGSYPDFVRQHPEFKGLNVTIPYKEEILGYLDEVDQEAGLVGAVNTIRLDKGRSKGYNTDIIGFEIALDELMQGKPVHLALILGTGGAAKAVAYVFKKRQIPYLSVSRQPGEAVLSYADLRDGWQVRADLIVNTTPLGMYPQTGGFPPLQWDLLHPGQYLMDLIYNPEKTVFLAEGQQRGCRILNGMLMLEQQAEASWNIWTQPSLTGLK